MSDQTGVLLAQLEKLSLNDPQKVLACSERLLAIDANLLQAVHCKGVAQMQLGKYDLARQTLEKALVLSNKKNKAQSGEVIFHLSATLYKLGAYGEAVATLNNIPEQQRSLGVQHLFAQCYYNLEEFTQCVEIYQAMLASGDFRDEQDKLEVITNLTAAYAAFDAKMVSTTLEEQETEQTSDLLYNAACALIEEREYDQALELLSAADGLARQENGVDVVATAGGGTQEDPYPDTLLDSEKGYFNDTASIIVQSAYIAHVRGDEVKAEMLLKKVVDRKPSSISTYAVACVNWAALKRHSEFFDTFRKLKHAATAQVQVKLTSKQKLYVKYNTALLLLNAGKLSTCISLVDSIIRENADSPLGPLAMTAALLKGKSTTVKAEAYLKEYLASKKGGASSSGDNAQLLMAQLWLEQGNMHKALQMLAEVQTLGANPAAIATLAEGYAEAGNQEAARATLQKAIDAKIPGAAEYAATFYLNRNQLQDAEKAFNKLLKNGDKNQANDKTLLAGLAASLVATDADEAYEIATTKLLSSTEMQAAASSNGAAIERQAVPRQALEAKGYKRATLLEGGQDKKKTRVRKMRRVPKDVKQLDGKPDPERWVPMRDRPSVKDMPPRRVREMRNFRASEQEGKRRAAEKRKAAAAVGTEEQQ